MFRKLAITRKEAIIDCKTIWKLVADGIVDNKQEALYLLPTLHHKYFDSSSCPLCAYSTQFEHRSFSSCIDHCPYYEQYGEYCQDTLGVDWLLTPKEFAQRIMNLK